MYCNMSVLELFKGSGSIGTYCKAQGYEVISLDIMEKYNATHTTDILQWDYRQYQPGHFHIVWASPPCTEYSALLNCRPERVRDLELADNIVIRVLDIIEYLKPKFWFIENPQTGLLKTRHFMDGLPYYDVTYCHYGYNYKKATRIWTNLIGFQPKFCKRDCQAYDHVKKKHTKELSRDYHLLQRYSIPQPLVKELMSKAFKENISVDNT